MLIDDQELIWIPALPLCVFSSYYVCVPSQELSELKLLYVVNCWCFASDQRIIRIALNTIVSLSFFADAVLHAHCYTIHV